MNATERIDPQAVPADETKVRTEQQPRRDRLAQVAERVRADARRDVRDYLESARVPAGGE